MQTKAMTIEAMDQAGKGLARIATLSAIDHDGDTYASGAFHKAVGQDQWAPILPAHDRKAMPFGKARIYEQGEAAYAELHLNLDTIAGKDWHSALKFDLEHGLPVQEWSYGYDVLDADADFRGGRKVRVLKSLDVHEVSTVVRGAGHGSATLSMKGLKAVELKEAHFAPLIAGLDELAAALGEDVTCLSATGVKQLDAIRDRLQAALATIHATQWVQPSEEERAAVEGAVASYLRTITRDHLAI